MLGWKLRGVSMLNSQSPPHASVEKAHRTGEVKFVMEYDERKAPFVGILRGLFCTKPGEDLRPTGGLCPSPLVKGSRKFSPSKKKVTSRLDWWIFHRTFQLSTLFLQAKKNRRVSKKNTRLKSIRGKNSYTVGRDLCRWNPAANPKFCPGGFFGGEKLEINQ